jgi:dienelactone hydrolase
MQMRLTVAIVVSAVAFLAADRPSDAAEQVELNDGGLRAIVYRPEGAGPFPTVVALHGCAGLVNRTSGKIVARFADWGDRLAAAGLAALFPDSYTSRGLTAQCGVRERAVRNARERVADAQAARRWLQNQGWAAKERVSVMGWAGGASTALWAARLRAVPRDGMPDFRSAVAFYPGCRQLANTAWSARIPTLILVGRSDDWTPAAPCEQMVAEARGRSARASIIVYPGAYHEFDRTDYPVRLRSGLAFSADGTGRAHVGTNPAAREDAIRRVRDWLMR